MRVQVQSVRLPRWVVPLLILAVLALIPIALTLAAAVAVLAIGATVVRSFLPASAEPKIQSKTHRFKPLDERSSNAAVIDADYEIKDEHEKS